MNDWNNDWDAVTADPGDGGSPGLFVSLSDDGSRIDFVPLTAPMERWIKWPDGPGRPEDCDPGTPGGSCTYVLQVYDVANGMVRILDLKPPAFRAFRDEVKSDGPRNVFRLRRKGAGKSTSWICNVRQAAPPAAYNAPLEELQMQLFKIGEGKRRRLARMDPGAAAMPPAGPEDESGYRSYHDEGPPF